MLLLFNPDNRKALLDYIELLKDRGQDAKASLCGAVRTLSFPTTPRSPLSNATGMGRQPRRAGVYAPEASDSAAADLTASWQAPASTGPRQPRPLGHARDAIKVGARVLIWALMLREVQMRYLRSPFGFVWAILQPVIHLGIARTVDVRPW